VTAGSKWGLGAQAEAKVVHDLAADIARRLDNIEAEQARTRAAAKASREFRGIEEANE